MKVHSTLARLLTLGIISCLPFVTTAEEAPAVPASVVAKAASEPLLPYGFSVTLTGVSDYTFLGISQTGGLPALQGSLDWKHASGAYAGIWTSNVDFKDHSATRQELDYYVGFNHALGKLETDVSLLHVQYLSPKSGFDYDYDEAKLMLKYPVHDLFSLTNEWRYSPDYTSNSGEEYYVQGGVSVPLPYDVTFNTAYGRQWVEKNDRYGYPDFSNWKAGLAYNLMGFDLGANYSNTDISRDTCANNCDGRVVFSVARTF